MVISEISTDRHPEREVLFLERLKGEDPKDMMIGSSFMNTSLWALIIVLYVSFTPLQPVELLHSSPALSADFPERVTRFPVVVRIR